MSDSIHQHGFTLGELMITVSITGILASIAVPSMNNFLNLQRAKNDIRALKHVISSARAQAIQTQLPVVICPTKASGECERQWDKPIQVFIDANNNQIQEEGEKILNIIDASDTNFSLRSFQRTFLRFTNRGFSNTGSFTYCALTQPETSSVLIFSRMGRSRPGQDSNNNGIVELANGNDAPCPVP